MRRPPALLALILSLVAVAGCASAPPAPEPLAHPYKVVLLPIEGAEAALAAVPTDADEEGAAGQVPFALTPDALRSHIRDGIVESGIFSQVVLAEEAGTAGTDVEDEIVAAARLARQQHADLIMRVRVNSARMEDLGPNESAFWSTLSWFMVPLPIWLSDDRTYATTLSVQAELYDPADAIKPTASVVASSGEQQLDLWDRGLTPLVAIVPPPWLEGDAETVSATLTERAVAQLMGELLEELRTREIPSRFDIDLVREGGEIVVRIASRRKLRSLEVLAGGVTVRSWAERQTEELVDAAASAEGRIAYATRVAIPPRPEDAQERRLVRVIAEDEAGGREVRTLLLGVGE